MALIDVTDMSYAYGARPVFDRVSFTVKEGSVFCLIGPNGCGKTTLLDCILGVLTPDSGTLMILGREAASCGSAWRVRSMAYVPQSHEGAFPYTVLDMVLMGRTAHLPFFSSPGRQDAAVALDALDKVGIVAMRDRPFTMLSGGERQLVLIARALAQETPVIVMDEPTAHLDFSHEFIVLETITALVREKGLAVIMATHFPNHAFYFENHGIDTQVAMLRHGGFIRSGTPEAVLTREYIHTLYGIDSTIVTFDQNGRTRKHVIPVKGDRV
ncbi:ABC transporter ATP-binding protein [Desulfatiferula olefinivorans]